MCVCTNPAEEVVVAISSNGSHPRLSALRGDHGVAAGVSHVPGLYEAPTLPHLVLIVEVPRYRSYWLLVIHRPKDTVHLQPQVAGVCES